MMPGRSVRSAKSSGEHLKEATTLAGSVAATANILPPILKTRSLTHCTCSVTCGNDMQQRRMASRFMWSSLSRGYSVWVFASWRLGECELFLDAETREKKRFHRRGAAA